MVINTFEMTAVSHCSFGQWRAPGSQDSAYHTLDYWVEVAKIAERGKFDAVFIADILGIQDVYGGTAAPALQGGVSAPSIDPTCVVPAMAMATEKVGLGITVATTYEQPYLLARRFSSLDHVTNGRIGWNVVTAFTNSAAANLGEKGQIPHDERYAMAEEFLDVAYKLWEGSWEDGAVVADAETGVFTDPERVHPIGHRGKYYSVPGIHMCAPSPQRTPFIYQAGASEVGRRFAARHGEGIFIVGLTPEQARVVCDDIRDKAEEGGRPRDSIKIVTALTVIAAETDEAAHEKLERYRETAYLPANVAYLSSVTGVDFSGQGLDEPLEYSRSEAIQSILTLFTTADPTRTWTLREVMDFMAIGVFGPVVVGGPQTVADELERWMDVGDVDGFNLPRVASHETMNSFVDHVVPELQRRGRMWQEYPEGDTHRARAFGASAVADWHPASAYRGAYVGRADATEPIPYGD